MDWGLEAVVKGATYNNPTEAEWFELRENGYGYDYGISQPWLSVGDDFLEEAKVFDDYLEEVYKPFYSGFQCNSSSWPIRETPGSEGHEKSPEISPVTAITDAALVTKYKRRKNKQKRVVEHVTPDGMSMDKWAWRKYGQKPIKGSPYPRSYYRCSSSRECMARKQVERSTSDPNTFIISYTEEHNHDQPTRRNALAGSTRSKLSTASTSTNKNNSPAASVELGLVESPINSSGENSTEYYGRESDDVKMINRSGGGGGEEEEFRFLGFEEMEGLELWWPTAI